MIEVPATRDKQDIPKLGALIGKANAGPVTLNNVEYATGCLRFCGFESRCVGGHKYGGVLKFELVTAGSEHEHKCFFGEILGEKPPVKNTRKRGE